MSDISLNPYLFFPGTCRQAMEFYQSIFGGELTLQTAGEMMGPDAKKPDSIMHAQLLGGAFTFMASDGTRDTAYEAGPVSLSINGSDEEKMTEFFQKLSDGGTVTSPLQVEMWGDTFGMLTDRYGIDWMMNITK